MTQALLNKLNVTIEKTVNLAEKMPKAEGFDFGKLFDSKTNNLNKQFNNKQKMEEHSNKVSNITDNKDKLKENLKDATSTLNDTNDKKQVKQDFKKDNKSEDDLNIKKTTETEADLNVNNDTVNDTENSTSEEETSITDDETIITEEVPTMYNELNTLEDPTTILLLQTQIQKNIKNCLENELTEDFQENNLPLKTEENTLTNNVIFKQFDSVISKDAGVSQFAQNITPKETAQSKSTSSKLSDVINENILKELNVEVVSSQSAEAETSFGDLMQNQSPQEQAARVMIQGDVKYDAVASKTLENIQVKPAVITPSKIIEQISKQLDGMVNNSKLNMVLNPENLGKVNVQLMNTKEGLLAQFTVTTQDVKDILLKGLDGLKESLLAQGINVDNVSVKLEETDNEYNPDYTEQEGSKGGNKQQGAKQQKENEKTFEELIGANIEEETNEV